MRPRIQQQQQKQLLLWRCIELIEYVRVKDHLSRFVASLCRCCPDVSRVFVSVCVCVICFFFSRIIFFYYRAIIFNIFILFLIIFISIFRNLIIISRERKKNNNYEERLLWMINLSNLVWVWVREIYWEFRRKRTSCVWNLRARRQLI